MPGATHTSNFVNVNGIRLHYLDWGGPGPALIFLAGMGSSAYIFNQFAPRFSDRFRVLGLTRRGHGDSDYPESGYDADTLVADICGFMDALGIEKAAFAGHSIAGVELTQLAATHPERVERLVYIEALDDRRSLPAVEQQDPLRGVSFPKAEAPPPRTVEEYIAQFKADAPAFAEIWSEVWDEEIAHGVTVNEAGLVVDRMPDAVGQQMNENLVRSYAPPTVNTTIPALSFFGQRQRKLSDAYTAEQKAAYHRYYETVALPAFHALVADFQHRFPQAKVVVIPGGHHYLFMAQADQVYAEMRRFLLD